MTSNSVAVIRYQFDNHLGSASLELDENAEIISYEEYHPFGTTSYRSGRTETETSQKRYKYVGKERDEETGLYYYGFRYYATWLCRFVSVDPLQFDYPHYTPFQYAGNKPISYIDLDGLEPALPDHIKPTDRIKGPGKLSGMTYQFLLDVLNASYQKVMEDNYIVEDGKGGHQFNEKRWKKENVSHLTQGNRI